MVYQKNTELKEKDDLLIRNTTIYVWLIGEIKNHRPYFS